MSFDLTILTQRIEGLKTTFENGHFGDALVGALNTGSGIMQQRIFEANEDVNGNSFGQYVGKKTKTKLVTSKNRTQNKRNKSIADIYLTDYQRKRARAGRQVSHKDLEFTGGLRRAIETQVENENVAVIQFNNDDAAMIAKGQEAQITNIRNGQRGSTKGEGVRIFTLSEAEKKDVTGQGLELIKQILLPNGKIS